MHGGALSPGGVVREPGWPLLFKGHAQPEVRAFEIKHEIDFAECYGVAQSAGLFLVSSGPMLEKK